MPPETPHGPPPPFPGEEKQIATPREFHVHELLNIHMTCWKSLVKGHLYIRGAKNDTLFYDLRVCNDLKTDRGVMRGIFVRGRATALFHIGGLVTCNARYLGWRTMAYSKFHHYCRVAETEERSAGMTDEGQDKEGDKYVSTPFADTVFNIEYQRLSEANKRLRLGLASSLKCAGWRKTFFIIFFANYCSSQGG